MKAFFRWLGKKILEALMQEAAERMLEKQKAAQAAYVEAQQLLEQAAQLQAEAKAAEEAAAKLSALPTPEA